MKVSKNFKNWQVSPLRLWSETCVHGVIPVTKKQIGVSAFKAKDVATAMAKVIEVKNGQYKVAEDIAGVKVDEPKFAKSNVVVQSKAVAPKAIPAQVILAQVIPAQVIPGNVVSAKVVPAKVIESKVILAQVVLSNIAKSRDAQSKEAVSKGAKALPIVSDLDEAGWSVIVNMHKTVDFDGDEIEEDGFLMI